MCREKRHGPSLGRSREVKAEEPRRRRQDAIGGGGSCGTSEGYVTDDRREGREAPTKASRAEAPEQGKPTLGGITGPWADVGSSTAAQQAKAVKERRYPNCPRRLVIA